jgi:pimeloyl-ACP methyl ester carboxylesterase
MSTFDHHRVRANGVNMHYVDAGEGPCVVLLHGFPETWYAWHYRVIVPDLRGYGATEKPAVGYDKRTMANDIRDLIRVLGIEKVAIIGHDRGARVATRFVKDHPDVTACFASLDNIPTKVIFENMNAEVAQAAWFFLFQGVRDLPEALIQGREELWLRSILTSWTYDPHAISEEALAVYVKAFAQPGGLRGPFEDYRAWREDLAQDQADASRLLASCPVLALWGADYDAAKMVDMKAIWSSMASRLHTLPIARSGHLPHEEQPDQVTAALLQFLGEFHPAP